MTGPAPVPSAQTIDWPRPGATLTPPAIVATRALAGRIVAIDAGHGAPGNTGARSCRCEDEQDVVLPIADAVADALQNAGLTVVRLREGEQRPTYSARLATLSDSGAELLVSVHADVRFPARAWTPSPGCDSLVSEGQNGFSVLWSDEDAELTPRRHDLARALAERLLQTRLPAYDGQDYVGLYAQTAPGVFVDRHRPSQRVRLLRRPAVPSVIVEVGHLLDPDAADRLAEPRVRAAIAFGIAGGVVDALQEG